MEFSTICIVLLGIITVFLLGTVFVLWLRVKNLKHYCMAIDSRIDSVRLNYLIGLRNLLIQQERFEDVEYIDELIKDEYPGINLKEVTIDDMINLL
jgi:hypothetical protein|nr:MAG TPA: hypothetical protein [Caudoviricetes sp.]